MTSNMSTVDVIISSMVFNYLKKIDTKLAQAFKKKTNALTLSKGSPEIHVIFNHFIKTNTLSKKIKLDAVDDDNIENNVQKKQKKALNNSSQSEAEGKDINQLNISAAAADPIENTTVGVDLDYESDESSEDLQLPTQSKNDISGGEMEEVEGEDEDDDSEDESDNESNEDDGLDTKDSDSNDEPEEISFKSKTQEQSEDQENGSDWASKRGRGGFRNRGGFHRGRGQGWGEGRGGGGGHRGNFRGGFRGGFRGRFNDNRGGRGGGRGRGRFGGQEGSRGRGNFNNRHSNDFHGSPPQAKKLKFDN
ncbi:hypothetical protein RI129_004442 [Pyrocoelia pectoralis]|uniref:Uncharacterized protein n=1 Tax=Pyrocoelia pectoralis TaxID=417401 RepID=A0AAN7VIY1_9COLE